MKAVHVKRKQTLNGYDLSAIEELTVTGNDYKSIDLSQMPNLKVLHIGGSNYTFELKGTLSNLVSLTLQHANIKFSNDFSVPNLQKLYLYAVNHSGSLSWIKSTAVREIYCNSINMRYWDMTLPDTVEVVALINCKICCDIAELRLDQLSNLRTINLASNSITGTVVLQEFSKYESANLCNNRLKLVLPDMPQGLKLNGNPLL